MRHSCALWALLVLAAAAGCSETAFSSPERVEKERVLGGRVTVQADPTRATPAPGEAASYELLLASPSGPVQWTYLLAVCSFLRDRDGLPFCDPELPLIAHTGATPALATPPDQLPRLDFVVPESLREDEHALLLQGLVCPGGPFDQALLSALAADDYSGLAAGRNPCADKSRNGVIISAPFAIERSPDRRNHAPLITRVSWSEAILDPPVPGETWASTAAGDGSGEGCRGTGLLEVPRKQLLGFQFELDEGAREEYLDPSPIAGEAPRRRIEVPRVEGFASAGRFEILRDHQLEAAQLLQLEWSLPRAKVDERGLLVRFWFIASDDRADETQASSWLERALCVLP